MGAFTRTRGFIRLLLSGLLSHKIKASLVYWKLTNVLPGHEAFTKHGCLSGASGVSGDGAGDPLDMLKHALNAPETAAGENGDLGCRLRVRRFIEHRRRGRTRTLGRRREAP